MNYLKVDKSRMVNLEYSLSREILRSNLRGAYHYTTIVECNTRKQHGLLVMPVPELDDTNHVMLSSFDETVIQHGAEFHLGIHKYDGDNYSPMGHKYIREFNCDNVPRTIYRVGGVILSKEKMFSRTDNQILIRYTLMDVHSPTTLRFKPFLAFRNINDLTMENEDINRTYHEVENGISTSMYPGYPELFMQFSKKVSFVFSPVWYKGIEYREDMQEGLSYKEDLYVPGYFELTIKKGESIVFSAGDKQVNTGELLETFENGLKDRSPRSSFHNCIKNSAPQFYFNPCGEEFYILEGYPWFKVNARSQFISLPGLTLGVNNREMFEKIMDTAIPALNSFMAEEENNTYIKDIEEPDVLLWAVWSLGRYARQFRENYLGKYGSFVTDVIRYILNGGHPNLKVLDNGLLYSEGKDKPISWMNTTAMGKPIVPRTGCLVEFNALWYNALMLALEIVADDEPGELQKELTSLSEKVKTSFNEVFVNEFGYLFDYVDGDYKSWSVRPNMIIAVSVDYSPLERKTKRSVLDIVTKELLTPKGLRSLSPKSEGYSPYYSGDKYQKDYAHVNGTAFPWLLSPYVEACINIFQKSGFFHIERVVTGIEEEMANNCIGSLSQLYDGNPPYTGHSAPSYALNVAGVAMVLSLYESVVKEFSI